jgi:AraC-like DNA-binding protein
VSHATLPSVQVSCDSSRSGYAAETYRAPSQAGDAQSRHAGPLPRACDSVRVARLVLAAAAAGGADPRQLAHEARVPAWALADDGAMIPACHVLRLWEVAEDALQQPNMALTVAGRCQLGDLSLYDYLFRTTATLRAGLTASSRYLPLVTTNGQLSMTAETEWETTYSYSFIDGGGRGQDLALQFAMALLVFRARAGTGRPVVPARVTFTQPAPRFYRTFTETFGSSAIDFGAPANELTIYASDLDLPMRDADPRLASILSRFTASVPPPVAATWLDYFREQLSDTIEHGSPSLAALARRMSLSARTLQRRLAEHHTTWRAELDTARRQHAHRARQAGPASMTHLARQLGYADPRSARRALRRWENPPGPVSDAY